MKFDIKIYFFIIEIHKIALYKKLMHIPPAWTDKYHTKPIEFSLSKTLRK